MQLATGGRKAEKKVYIVDDNERDCKALSSIFERAGFNSTIYTSSKSFLKAANNLQQGCVVLDIKMPEIDGLQILEELSENRSDMPVIMVSGHGDVPTAVGALHRGAIDFVEKPFSSADIIGSAQRAFDSLSMLKNKALNDMKVADILAKISKREMQVLKLLLGGEKNKSVAFELGISERTVEVHRTRMMKRLGVKSFAELIRMALSAGVVPEKARLA